MKHTQGKWTAFDHGGFGVTNGDTVICIAGETDLKENEANANLIASAPEMYELLKRLSEDWEVDFKHQYDMIAVLAKAEGNYICSECDGKGYLKDVLNTKDNIVEIQRCDNCQQFETDTEARVWGYRQNEGK